MVTDLVLSKAQTFTKKIKLWLGSNFKKRDTFINKQCSSDRPLNTNKATKLSSTPADLCRFTVERFKGNR